MIQIIGISVFSVLMYIANKINVSYSIEDIQQLNLIHSNVKNIHLASEYEGL